MELKINCTCGQHYTFSVEPVAGQMPVPVACPACGVDCTTRANALLVAKLRAQEASAAATSKPPSVGLGGAMAPASAGSSSRSASTSRHFSTGASTSASEALAAMSPARRHAAQTRITQSQAGPETGKVLLGAVLGAGLVTGVWFAIWKTTGNAADFMALVGGWAAGYLAQRMGQSKGAGLALAVAGIAAVFVVGFEFHRLSTELNTFIHDTTTRLDRLYDEEVTKSKEIIAAIPRGTDEEIRAYITKRTERPGEPFDPSIINAGHIQRFRLESLARAKEFVEKKSRADFRKEWQGPGQNLPATTGERLGYMSKSLGTFGALFILIGLVAAWRYGYGEMG